MGIDKSVDKSVDEMVTIYAYATGFIRDENGTPIMIATECDKEMYEIQRRINWQTAYKYVVSKGEAVRIRKILKQSNHGKSK